jgi:hypothetical protein
MVALTLTIRIWPCSRPECSNSGAGYSSQGVTSSRVPVAVLGRDDFFFFFAIGSCCDADCSEARDRAGLRVGRSGTDCATDGYAPTRNGSLASDLGAPVGSASTLCNPAGMLLLSRCQRLPVPLSFRSLLERESDWDLSNGGRFMSFEPFAAASTSGDMGSGSMQSLGHPVDGVGVKSVL